MFKIDNTYPELVKYLKRHAINDKIYTYDNSKKFILNKKGFICGGCELLYVYDYLKCIHKNIYHTFENKTSMNIFSELHSPNTIIRKFDADYYILSDIQLYKSLLARYQNKGYFKEPNMFNKNIKELFDNLNYSIKEIRKFSCKPIWITTMCYISDETLFGHNEFLINRKTLSFYEMIKVIELEIYKTAKTNENVYVLNIDSITEKYNKYDCIKPYQGYPYGHLSYFGSALVAEAFYTQLSYLEKSINRIKCIVFDLDNTLWKGILIEDGEDNIKINQQMCNVLYGMAQRGIILGVCSKNDPSIHEKIFSIIKKDLYGQHIIPFICAWRINWSPKSQNIIEIAHELNIGLDTIAFLDDNEFERNEVINGTNNAVRVYNEKDIFKFLSHPEFNQLLGVINSDNDKRLKTYKENKNRNKELKEINNNVNNVNNVNNAFTNFMVNSKFNLDINFAKENELNRIFELLQKTNQMNATLERSNLENIKNWHKSNNHIIFSVSLRDKFGDYGNVGGIVIEIYDKTALIKEFAISCRAMGKMVEDAIIIKIISHLKSIDVNAIKIKLEETDKNKNFINIFKKYDFVCNNDKNNKILEHKISDKKYNYPVWFKY